MNLSSVIFFLFIPITSFSQSWNEKTQVFQIGVGESANFKTQVKEQRSKYTSTNTRNLGSLSIKSTPAFFVKFESALNKYIGIGVAISYRKTEITQAIPYNYYDSSVAYPSYYGYYYKVKRANDIFDFTLHDINIGARLNYHFSPDKKLDPYIGVALGYRIFNRDYQYSTDNPHGVYYVVEYEKILPLYIAGTLGVRYIFKNSLGIYAEIGFDNWSVIQGGIVFRVK